MASDRTFSARCVWRDTLEKALPVAITVSHRTDLVFSLRMPGTTPDNPDWQPASGQAASRAGGVISSRFLVSPQDIFVASGGGLPLMLRGGTLIGRAAGSGLPDVEEHEIVARGLGKLDGQIPLSFKVFAIYLRTSNGLPASARQLLCPWDKSEAEQNNL